MLSTCPVVRGEVMDLWQCVQVGGRSQLLPFKERILWLRESECKLELRHGDRFIKDLCTLNDWCGFLTSIEVAVQQDIPQIVQRLDIKPGDKLHVVAVVTVSDNPCLPDTSKDGLEWNARAGRKKYRPLPSYRDGGPWFTSDQKVNPAEEYSPYPTLKPGTVLAGQLIYDTAVDPAGNMPDALAKAISQCRADAVAVGSSPPVEVE